MVYLKNCIPSQPLSEDRIGGIWISVEWISVRWLKLETPYDPRGHRKREKRLLVLHFIAYDFLNV